MSSLRRLKRKQTKAPAHLSEDQKRLPSGRVLTDPVKGEFLSMPLLGWIAIRDRELIPLVQLVVTLLDEQFQLQGTLQLEWPLYLETEARTVAALQSYGWVGGVWKPGDSEWPTGEKEIETQLTTLVKSSGLSASLTFPPSETGMSRSVPIEVTRAHGNFLMPPLPKEDPDPELVETLRAIVKNYRLFHS